MSPITIIVYNYIDLGTERKEAQSIESDVEMTPTGSQGIVQSLC